MLVNVIYILPMILGRTFDARFDRVGTDIFPQSELDKARTIPDPEYIFQHEIIDSAENMRRLLDIPAHISLKVKAGTLDLRGPGSYLKDLPKMGRTIEILTYLKFKTVTISLPSAVQPFKGWSHKPKNVLGTHFVKSIAYGGELLASIRFKPNNEKDFNFTRSVITGNFPRGDAKSLLAKGKLESLQNSLKDKASMEFSYYTTVPPFQIVDNTIDGLRNLIRDFDQHVKKVNNGLGVPIRVELMELSSLRGENSSKFQFLKNRDLESELDEMEREFDDLITAKTQLAELLKYLPESRTEEQQEEIGKLQDRISKISKLYYDSIRRLNLEEGPEEQIKEARDAYKEGKIITLPGKFTKEVNKLKRRMMY